MENKDLVTIAEKKIYQSPEIKDFGLISETTKTGPGPGPDGADFATYLS